MVPEIAATLQQKEHQIKTHETQGNDHCAFLSDSLL